MRTPIFIGLLAPFALLAAATAEEPASKGMGVAVLPKVIPATGRDRATDEQVQAMQAASKAGKTVEPDAARNALSIESTSQFIQLEGDTTLVPKGAIVFVPAKQKSHVVTAPGANMLSWTEFRSKHRGLICTLNVTLEQAAGTKPIEPGAFRAARSTGMIVVALYQQSPISVSPQALAARP